MTPKSTSGQTLRDDRHGESDQRLAMQLSKANVRSKHCGHWPLFLTIAQIAQTRMLRLWDCVKRNW
jgi:hypothetical protein